MKKLFNPEIVKILLGIIGLLLIIKLLWVIVEMLWLTAVDIDQVEDQSSKTLFYRVKLSPKEGKAPPTKVIKKPVKITGSIKEIKLWLFIMHQI